MTILEAMSDPKVFGKLFRKPETFSAWRVLLSAIFGLPIRRESDLKLLREATGRTEYRPRRMKEVLILAGRRSGKSFMSALIACYLAIFEEWKNLAEGERGVVMIIANDRQQAQIVFRYVKGILRTLGKRFIAKERTESIELRNGILIEIRATSYRSVRGYTLLAVIAEEISFWRDAETSASPAKEILIALRPSLATVERSLLIMISTPYDRSGVVFETYSRNFGKAEASTLVWKSPTRVLNPTISEETVAQALAEDSVSARAEWLAEFRADVESFVSLEAVQALVSPRAEIAWDYRTSYVGFIDPSSGRRDSFCLAIAHKKGEKAVLDVAREIRAPFNPSKAVKEFAEVLRGYQIKKILSDQYAVGYVSEAFRKEGITVEASELNASELYLELLPMMNSGTVELLNSERLVNQLVGLERRTRTTGRDLVTHFPTSHDDLANAVAGALVLARIRSKKSVFFKQYPEIDFFEERVPTPMTMRNFDPNSLSEEEADEIFSQGFRIPCVGSKPDRRFRR
jgi:hypothetical protein